MSVAGYFVPDRPRKKLPEEEGSEVEKVRLGRPDGERLPGGLVRKGDEGVFYEDVDEYDPVLRGHCRL